MTSFAGAIRSLLQRIFGSAVREDERLGCSIGEIQVRSSSTIAKGHFKKTFESNRQTQVIRRRQLESALGRLDQTIKEFGDELVTTARNGNGGDGRDT